MFHVSSLSLSKAAKSSGTMLDQLNAMLLQEHNTKHDLSVTLGSIVTLARAHVPARHAVTRDTIVHCIPVHYWVVISIFSEEIKLPNVYQPKYVGSRLIFYHCAVAHIRRSWPAKTPALLLVSCLGGCQSSSNSWGLLPPWPCPPRSGVEAELTPDHRGPRCCHRCQHTCPLVDPINRIPD